MISNYEYDITVMQVGFNRTDMFSELWKVAYSCNTEDSFYITKDKYNVGVYKFMNIIDLT